MKVKYRECDICGCKLPIRKTDFSMWIPFRKPILKKFDYFSDNGFPFYVRVDMCDKCGKKLMEIIRAKRKEEDNV